MIDDIVVPGHRNTSAMWKVKMAAKNPGMAWNYLRRTNTLLKLCSATKQDLEKYNAELRKLELAQYVSRQLAKYADNGLGYCSRSPELYIITRMMKPTVFIETGVRNGVSSLFILTAMKKNGSGRLYSVDLPNEQLEGGGKTGWIVPEDLRDIWDLRFGDSLELLPGLFAKEAASVDVFFHDSDHSYNFMKREFNLAKPHIRKGGILLADDAFGNNAFIEFCRENSYHPYSFGNMGATVIF